MYQCTYVCTRITVLMYHCTTHLCNNIPRTVPKCSKQTFLVCRLLRLQPRSPALESTHSHEPGGGEAEEAGAGKDNQRQQRQSEEEGEEKEEKSRCGWEQGDAGHLRLVGYMPGHATIWYKWPFYFSTTSLAVTSCHLLSLCFQPAIFIIFMSSFAQNNPATYTV